MTAPRDPHTTLLTAWHLRSVWQMPRAFLWVRALERDSRRAPGLRWMHRWISRRSLLLTSRWDSPDAARDWLKSDGFRAVDRRLRALPGSTALVELSHPVVDETSLWGAGDELTAD